MKQIITTFVVLATLAFNSQAFAQSEEPNRQVSEKGPIVKDDSTSVAELSFSEKDMTGVLRVMFTSDVYPVSFLNVDTTSGRPVKLAGMAYDVPLYGYVDVLVSFTVISTGYRQYKFQAVNRAGITWVHREFWKKPEVQ